MNNLEKKGLGDGDQMREAGVAPGQCSLKSTLLWDRWALGVMGGPPRDKPPASTPITGPAAGRRNRPTANACSAGPETATCSQPNPRHAATLSRVAGRCEARPVGSDQRRL